jgi:hypothetical protein
VINYLEFDEKGITVVRCMKCGAVVATRQTVEGAPMLVHMSHSKRHRVSLADGTVADIIVCADCVVLVTPDDYQDFEDAAKWGWKREHMWKFNESERVVDRAAYLRFKDQNQITDKENKFPKRVFDAMFENKTIIKQGSKK